VGLWQQIKSGQIVCEELEIPTEANGGSRSFYTDDREQWDIAAGKALIARTVHQISDLWNEVETSGGSLAWEWIFNCSHHGALIRLAEDRVNAVGSKGKREALESACAAWLAAWQDGICGWKDTGIVAAMRPKRLVEPI
jgi:hypothetical protein